MYYNTYEVSVKINENWETVYKFAEPDALGRIIDELRSIYGYDVEIEIK